MSGFLQNPGGGGGGGVTFLNGLTGALTILPGTGISVSAVGSNITIAINETGNPNEIRYFNAAGASSNDSNFIRDLTNDSFKFASNVIGQTTRGIFYNGAGAAAPLGAHAGLGIDMRAGSVLTTLGYVGVGNGTHVAIEDGALRMLTYVQDFYIDGYNQTHSFFIETTNTYHDVYMGDVGLNTNHNRIVLADSANTLDFFLGGFFQVKSSVTLAPAFAVDPVNIIVAGGDTLLTNNGFRFAIFDGVKVMDFATPLGQGRFGDIDSSGNGNVYEVDDLNYLFGFRTGVIRGTAFHNNANVSQGSSIQQDIRSGTYTPTLTNGVNVTSSVSHLANWHRVGNIVYVEGQIDITPTGNNAQTVVKLSLPVLTNMTTGYELNGQCKYQNSTVAGPSGTITADTVGDLGELSYFETAVGAGTMVYEFSYEVK